MQDLTTFNKYWPEITPSIRASLVQTRVQDRALATNRMAHYINDTDVAA